MEKIKRYKSAHTYHLRAMYYQQRIDKIKQEALDGLDNEEYIRKCAQVRKEFLDECNAAKPKYEKWRSSPDFKIEAAELRRIRDEKLDILRWMMNKRKAIKKRRGEMKKYQIKRDHAIAWVKRIRARESKLRVIESGVCEFFNISMSDLANPKLKSEVVVMARRVFCKYGLENGIMGYYISVHTNISKKHVGERRLALTRSFQTNPDAKKTWTEFVSFMNLKGQNGLKKAA